MLYKIADIYGLYICYIFIRVLSNCIMYSDGYLYSNIWLYFATTILLGVYSNIFYTKSKFIIHSFNH